jgi:hypothetical protein
MTVKDNEFGFTDLQIRADMIVKNATVFEVSRNAIIHEILGHGDVNEQDLQKMADSGRTFFVLPEMGERHGDRGWRDFWTENVIFRPGRHEMPFIMTTKNITEFRDFARVVVDDFAWETNWKFRRWV